MVCGVAIVTTEPGREVAGGRTVEVFFGILQGGGFEGIETAWWCFATSSTGSAGGSEGIAVVCHLLGFPLQSLPAWLFLRHLLHW